MEATCVTHIGICVRDMGKSLSFYRDILGMTIIGEKLTEPTEGSSQGARLSNYKLERKSRHFVSLSYGTGLTPTLTLTSHPEEQHSGTPIMLDQIGISHLSFGVDDVKSLVNELLDKGVELAAPIETFTDANGDIHSVYFKDPDGILIQFNKPSTAWQTPVKGEGIS